MSYTAKSQLFFSMTRTSTPGTNDYNWYWYDGDGVRVVTQVGSGVGWVPSASPATATGPRSYYVYDGSDIALVLVRPTSTTGPGGTRAPSLAHLFTARRWHDGSYESPATILLTDYSK